MAPRGRRPGGRGCWRAISDHGRDGCHGAGVVGGWWRDRCRAGGRRAVGDVGNPGRGGGRDCRCGDRGCRRGGAGGGRGSVAACSAPADSACAPAAAGVPVVIPVVNDWPNDCGDNGAVAAAGGMPAAGTDGPPTPTAGALGVGVVRRYMVGVGPASAGYYRTLALPVTTSARCYVVAINLVPTDHCQALSLPGRSVRRYLAWLHLAPADHYRMLRLLVGIPPSAKSSRRR